ncbi:MAG: hypothetical protein DSY43_06770 [Gammaproteobacteria bacterium]|nr:MAG: hypothetical protein DSY43_06770 [Gammaproteobacteria bacterium]
MSQLLLDNFGYLHLLACCPSHQRAVLLTSATPEQVHAICEVCFNLLRGAIPLSHTQKGRLRPHADVLRELADSSVPYKTKKALLAQKGGGFVSDVMTPLMSALSLFLL